VGVTIEDRSALTRRIGGRHLPVARLAPDSGAMDSAASPHVTVFVVEDSPAIRERIVEMLAHVEAATLVGEAETALDAIDGIRRCAPDLVLLDIHLREGSGLEVLRATRDTAGRPMFVVLSNDTSAKQRSTCLAAGAKHFLDKSLDFLRITEIISTFAIQRGQPQLHRRAP